MTSIDLTRALLPAALFCFLLFAMVVPIVRLRRRTGARAVVVHETPVQRVMGAAMALASLAAGVWGALVALLGPDAIGVAHAPAIATACGWVLVAIGFFVTVVAQAQMGASWRIGIDVRPTDLVARGLFRLVRNPIYLGMLASMAGIALVTPSPWTLSLFLDTALVVGIQARLEEAHLGALHGPAYRAYASRVGRFVPGIGRLDPTS